MEGKKSRVLLISCIAFFLLSKNVYAYLFPGTGQAIIGGLWPLIVAFFMAVSAFLVKYFWKPIKKYVSKLLKVKTDK